MRTCVYASAAVYRFMHRLETLFKNRLQQRERVVPLPATSDDSAKSYQAPISSVAASVASVLCIDPSSRAAVITLLSAKTASLALQNHLKKHPEHANLAALGAW